jgi:hypothetical protein
LFLSTAALAIGGVLLMIAIALIAGDRVAPSASLSRPWRRESVSLNVSDDRKLRTVRLRGSAASRDRVVSVAQPAHSRETLRVAAIAEMCISILDETFLSIATPPAGRTRPVKLRGFRDGTGGFFRCASPGEHW